MLINMRQKKAINYLEINEKIDRYKTAILVRLYSSMTPTMANNILTTDHLFSDGTSDKYSSTVILLDTSYIIIKGGKAFL